MVRSRASCRWLVTRSPPVKATSISSPALRLALSAHLLQNGKTLKLPSDVHHSYADKYALAESVVSTAVAALQTALGELGADKSKLATLVGWAKDRSVTIALRGKETTTLVRSAEREQQSDTKSVTKSTVFGKSESYTVTKVRKNTSPLCC